MICKTAHNYLIQKMAAEISHDPGRSITLRAGFVPGDTVLESELKLESAHNEAGTGDISLVLSDRHLATTFLAPSLFRVEIPQIGVPGGTARTALAMRIRGERAPLQEIPQTDQGQSEVFI